MSNLNWIDLGRASYAAALEVQNRLLTQVAAEGPGCAYVVTVEHDPAVITLGRSAGRGHVLATAAALRAAGIELHQASRGGDVTWHGPGQLVVYPIVHVRPLGGLHRYLRCLEEAIIRTLATFGIDATRRAGLSGAWTGNDKIAAIGIAVRRWVTCHGLALNVCPDLRQFGLIVPCGLPDAGVTSMEKLLGRPVEVVAVRDVLLRRLAEVMGFEHVAQAAIPSAVDPAPVAASPVPKDAAPRPRLPAWFRRRLPTGPQAGRVRALLSDLGLHTVCSSAHCPNLCECFSRGTATFLLMGPRCTRACGFCAIQRGPMLPLRADEPAAVAHACRRLGLRHVVMTSVTRDDLPDGGAEHFARTIQAVRETLADATIEVLTPDFGGDLVAVDIVLAAGPDVFNHNIETVRRLTTQIRPQADYDRSLAVLAHAALAHSPAGLLVKSGLMVGLGESDDEVSGAMGDLQRSGCGVLTIGQYLAPSADHWPVARFVEPEQFDRYRAEALAMGFAAVASGPLVRSSYNAQDLLPGRGSARQSPA